MISEALELRMEGGPVSHSKCMCVVSHGVGGLDGGTMEVVADKDARQSQGGRSHVRRCWSISGVSGDTLMTPDHTAVQVGSSG